MKTIEGSSNAVLQSDDSLSAPFSTSEDFLSMCTLSWTCT